MLLDQVESIVEKTDSIPPLALGSGGELLPDLGSLDLDQNPPQRGGARREPPGGESSLEAEEILGEVVDSCLLDDEAADHKERLDAGGGVREDSGASGLVHIADEHCGLTNNHGHLAVAVGFAAWPPKGLSSAGTNVRIV